MTDVKLPIDARGGNTFYASGLLKKGERADGAREYLVLAHPDKPPLVECHSPLQLHVVYRGLTLHQSKVEEGVVNMCTTLVGEVMSKRVHGVDYYDSGRENWDYELAWLPGDSTYDKIVRTLETSGEHGLAALMREGRVTPK